MSTLTTEDSSPVKVAQVVADFRHGMPDSGIVYVGAERHRVRVYRTADGLMGMCACPGGCAAILDAIRAVEIMAEAWERSPRARARAGIEVDGGLDPAVEPEQRVRRPYDGLARAMCEADLVPMDVPRWAYDERGIRRPLLEAEMARDLWHGLHRALGRLPGEPKRAAADPSPVIKFYRASWEPDRGMVEAAFDVDLQTGPGDGGQPEGSA